MQTEQNREREREREREEFIYNMFINLDQLTQCRDLRTGVILENLQKFT